MSPSSENLVNSPNADAFHDDENEQYVDRNHKQQRNGSKKRKVAMKLPVFEESGITDAERRDLRNRQRTIALVLRDECPGIEHVEEQRCKNNDLFETKVCYTREAVLDADNVELIVAKYSKQIEKSVLVPRYDASKLARSLATKCSVKVGGSSFFDWKTLGRECGICFNAIPENVTFLAGSLDSQQDIQIKNARKPRQKEVVDDSKEEEPEAVKNSKADADQLSAAEKNMKQLKQVLKARAKEQEAKNKSKEIDGVQFLFNPESFTQTVENIFNFSFLIKKGDAEIGIDKKKSLYVKPQCKPTDDRIHEYSPTQAILSFTMRDWKRILMEHGEVTGDLPHRTGSKHAR